MGHCEDAATKRPMNLAALVQNQALATLLSVLASEQGGAAGRIIEARVLAIESDGTVTALVNGVKAGLVLAGAEAKQAAMQPGAMLSLRIDAPAEPGGAARATLVDVTPPAPPASPPPAPAAPPGAGLLPDAAGQPGTPDAERPASSGPVSHGSPAGQIDAGRSGAANARLPASPTPGAAEPAPAEKLASAGPAVVITPARTAQPMAAPLLAPFDRTAIGEPASPMPVAARASARALAGPLIGLALARQDSLAPLFANLGKLVGEPASPMLPRALPMLAQRILSSALPVDGRPITAAKLQAAVARSGLFLEARTQAPLAEPRPGPPQAAAMPQTDIKAGLLALREMLRPLMRAEAAPEPAPPGRRDQAPATSPLPEARSARPAPPRSGGPLAAQPLVEASLADGEKPTLVARTLLEQAEAALDRIKLAQFASLPPDLARDETQQGARWHVELPLAFPTGAAVLPLQIERDPPGRGGTGGTAPVWRMRFALDIEPMGPLHGVVTLQGRAVDVSLWAARSETSDALRGAAPDLQAALANARFQGGSVDIHTGRPMARSAPAGEFLDRLS